MKAPSPHAEHPQSREQPNLSLKLTESSTQGALSALALLGFKVSPGAFLDSQCGFESQSEASQSGFSEVCSKLDPEGMILSPIAGSHRTGKGGG